MSDRRPVTHRLKTKINQQLEISHKQSQENPHEFGDVLVGPFLRAAHRDQTNTFRKMPEDELKFIARTMFIFIERPFVDLDSLAGTEEHRRIALDNFLRLLGK